VDDPEVGKIVRYVLTDADAAKVNNRRARPTSPIKDLVSAGTEVPMMVVRVWSGLSIQGQALLAGDDALWLSPVEGAETLTAGCWSWPVPEPEAP
jgi:hypothetical protein